MNNKVGVITWNSGIDQWNLQLIKTGNLVVFNGILRVESQQTAETVIGTIPSDFIPRKSQPVFKVFPWNAQNQGEELTIEQNSSQIKTGAVAWNPHVYRFGGCYIV